MIYYAFVDENKKIIWLKKGLIANSSANKFDIAYSAATKTVAFKLMSAATMYDSTTFYNGKRTLALFNNISVNKPYFYAIMSETRNLIEYTQGADFVISSENEALNMLLGTIEDQDNGKIKPAALDIETVNSATIVRFGFVSFVEQNS